MTTKYLTGKAGVKGSPAYSTVDDLTLYVRSGGSDTANGLTVGTALLTIQEAVDRIPKQVRHDIVIDIGSGNFAGFLLTGLTVEDGSLVMQGTLGQPTVDGNETGTATGGTTTQLTDSGGGWTTSQLRGYLLLVDSEYRVIRDNTGTTIDVIGEYAGSTSGKAYEILEQKTVLDSYGPNTTGRAAVIANVSKRDGVIISNIKTSSGTVGFLGTQTDGFQLVRCCASGGAYSIYDYDCGHGFTLYDIYISGSSVNGLRIQRTASARYVNRVYIYNSSSNGAVFTDVALPEVDYLTVDSCTNEGVELGNCIEAVFTNLQLDGNGENMEIHSSQNVSIEDATIDNATNNGLTVYYVLNLEILGTTSISNNGGYGLQVGLDTATLNLMRGTVTVYGTAIIADNTSGGILVKDGSIIALDDVSGTGNGTYGLELETASVGIISSDTDITGSSGDATINSGTTVLDWTDDFGSDGDKAVNLDNQCMIERKDS